MGKRNKLDKIEFKIGIIQQTIYMYSVYIDSCGSDINNKFVQEIQEKLKIEENNLKYLKQKYPEYFI